MMFYDVLRARNRCRSSPEVSCVVESLTSIGLEEDLDVFSHGV